MIDIKKYTTILFLIFGIFIFSKNILILNSYSYDYTWTKNITWGILDTLNEKYSTYIEYMDTKRNNSDEYYKKLFDLYYMKYKDKKIDLVIASDDNAYNFIEKYGKKFLINIPVVFCGINYIQKTNINSSKNFYGIGEYEDIDGTINIALSLHSKIKNIYFLIDDFTQSGKIMFQELNDNINKYTTKYNKNFEIIKVNHLQESIKKIRTLKDGIIIIQAFLKDANENILSLEKSLEIIEKNSKLPIYGMLYSYLGHGIVGGVLTSGYYQGVEAAKISKKLLTNQKVSKEDILKATINSNQIFFDYNQMKKFNISKKLLPKKSILINNTQSFFEKYKKVILIYFFSITILTSIILFLIINIYKRKKAENIIQKQNMELESSYEELEAQHEELEATQEELTKNYKKIKSEKQKNIEINDKLNKIIEVTEKFSKMNTTFDEFCNTLLKAAIALIPEADYGSISIMEKDKWNYIATVGHDLNILKTLDLKPEYALQINGTQDIKSFEDFHLGNMPQNIKEKLYKASKPIKESLMTKINIEEKTLWICLDIDKKSIKTFKSYSKEIINTFIYLAEKFMRLNLRMDKVKSAYLDFSQKLATIAEAHDDCTGKHVIRVGALSELIAKKYGLNNDKVQDIKNFAPLHDVGKIFVSNEILTKNTKLSKEEWEEMKKHTIHAKRLLTGEYFEIALKIALNHHERYDGSGYPMGLKGNEIPIEAQIVSIADVYDALRSDRPYKKAFTHEETLNILLIGDGRTSPKHFNPKILKIFEENHKEIKTLFDKINKN
ncbi:hypothetical protein OSSY52_04280 [Tepiditoga spiralis]|uniref:HD-GYP domain-containing protein n=1 Tax=Tepiditoga spiralis TaxID=2108365 RepID=A0A7G1G620_9BACT|nr:HD domain-containing phosphohydrolase [Tepiditoga spiralis]BBE30287.1 hypothetical protein OSSY52_04280 [Tepiditoga spiralis]